MTVSTTAQYTPEQTAQMVELYTGGASVAFIAEMIGKSAKSVIAKLSREGVYKAKAKAKTSASTVVRKAQLIEAIAARAGVPAEKLDSLEKATKEALEILATVA